jgi:hypothetical protein
MDGDGGCSNVSEKRKCAGTGSAEEMLAYHGSSGAPAAEKNAVTGHDARP